MPEVDLDRLVRWAAALELAKSHLSAALFHDTEIPTVSLEALERSAIKANLAVEDVKKLFAENGIEFPWRQVATEALKEEK